MKRIAIRATGLSKRYRIPGVKQRHDTLADQLAAGTRSLLRRCAGRCLPADTGEFDALRELSFAIEQGELVGIVGHNGAGKSTLLKILSRITPPSAGSAELYGRVGSLLEVGTGFHPELSGRENIYLNGAVLGMRKEEIKRQFDDIVAFSGVERFLEMPVKRYSSGMYVRLAFAVAAHLEPEILLVDEVLAVGDLAFQKKCLGKIGSVARGGRTVIFISHNMTAVNSLCNRVIWLEKGRIVDDGPAARVVAAYMAAATEAGGSTEEAWDEPDQAPGSELVRLKRIRLRNREGAPSDPLTMQTPFALEVEYWNLSPGSRLQVTIHLHTAEGILAFSTGSQCSEPLPAGLFRSTGFFPGDLLNSGIHRFTVLVVQDSSRVLFGYESRVPLTILDLQQREGSCYGREPGVLQPRLEWMSEWLAPIPGSESPADVTLYGLQEV